MAMDFKQLKSFICIADVGSFTRAAQLCNTVQPALSNQIASLEEELGAKLFVRSSQGTTLTESGHELYSHAQQLLKAKDEAVNAIKSSLDNPVGAVKLGCINSLSNTLGPDIIESVRQQQSNIDLNLLSDSGSKLYKALLDASLDMAILFKAICIYDDKGALLHKEELFASTVLEYTRLFEESLYFCSHQNGDEAKIRDSIDTLPLKTVLNLPLLMPPVGHAISNTMQWLATVGGQDPTIVAQSNSIEVFRTLISRNVGHALLPSSLVPDDAPVANIVKRNIEGYRIKRSVILCSSKQTERLAAARAVRKIIEEQVKSDDKT